MTNTIQISLFLCVLYYLFYFSVLVFDFCLSPFSVVGGVGEIKVDL